VLGMRLVTNKSNCCQLNVTVQYVTVQYLMQQTVSVRGVAGVKHGNKCKRSWRDVLHLQ
jgi:hypothetical protein